ncbi:MAG TPA: hypothetical protein GX745_08610 [Clostridiales bacterium]|nr:hypothetical protein [Clostridiales bacterium]
MTSKRIMEIIKSTLTQLEGNATKCLEQKDAEHAKMYMEYATGVRMVLDNIEYAEDDKNDRQFNGE